MDLPEGSTNRTSATLTVGFDASPASVEATRWAIDYAQDGALTVEVMMAHEAGDHDVTLARIEQACRDIPIGRATLIPRPFSGDPVEVLLNAAEGSQLLVLGRHGVKSMIHSAMGSVGDTCARMATCPVVIVPSRADRVT